MSTELYELKTLNLKHQCDRIQLKDFLEREDLSLDADLDYALCISDGDKIIASGCAAGNVLKCIAVNESYQGQTITNRIMTYLRLRAYHEGFASLFLYTKPENEAVFKDLGFFLIASSENAILMENTSDGCQRYIDSLVLPENRKEAAVLVKNCNPFTLGHRYLIEKACRDHEVVHLFILKEDLSVFSFNDRMNLVRRGTKDLKNLYIHEGRDYIISRATFPSYFLKDQKILDRNHALLDLDLFSKKIAPSLGITTRLVGEEPFCPVTSLYNSLMKEILPPRGIKVVEIPRKEVEGAAVSATKVRKALAVGNIDQLKNWVPPSTYSFLISADGARYGKMIREKEHEDHENRLSRNTGVQ
jgi:[citrate (pro-3S)-lyase] ligase